MVKINEFLNLDIKSDSKIIIDYYSKETVLLYIYHERLLSH